MRGDILIINNGECITDVLFITRAFYKDGKSSITFFRTPFVKETPFQPEADFYQIGSLPPSFTTMPFSPSTLSYTVHALIMKYCFDMAASKMMRAQLGNSSLFSCSHCYHPAAQNLTKDADIKVTQIIFFVITYLIIEGIL
jgi:hypothetical protein